MFPTNVLLITKFFLHFYCIIYLNVKQIAYKWHILHVLGWRVGSRKVVLLITDGQSNKDRHLTIPNAEELKKIGVDIYVVAVGSNLDIVEIVKVAGPGSFNLHRPRDGYLFRVQDYNGFLKITKLVVQKANAGTPFSSPCYT